MDWIPAITGFVGALLGSGVTLFIALRTDAFNKATLAVEREKNKETLALEEARNKATFALEEARHEATLAVEREKILFLRKTEFVKALMPVVSDAAHWAAEHLSNVQSGLDPQDKRFEEVLNRLIAQIKPLQALRLEGMTFLGDEACQLIAQCIDWIVEARSANDKAAAGILLKAGPPLHKMARDVLREEVGIKRLSMPRKTGRP